jgi:hypothetical protein
MSWQNGMMREHIRSVRDDQLRALGARLASLAFAE